MVGDQLHRSRYVILLVLGEGVPPLFELVGVFDVSRHPQEYYLQVIRLASCIEWPMGRRTSRRGPLDMAHHRDPADQAIVIGWSSCTWQRTLEDCDTQAIGCFSTVVAAEIEEIPPGLRSSLETSTRPSHASRTRSTSAPSNRRAVASQPHDSMPLCCRC